MVRPHASYITRGTAASCHLQRCETCVKFNHHPPRPTSSHLTSPHLPFPYLTLLATEGDCAIVTNWARIRPHQSCLQMRRGCLQDLPAELLSEIIGLLPISDRARLEAVCKTFLHISRREATKIDSRLTTFREAKGLSEWLQRIEPLKLQTLWLVAPPDWWADPEGVMSGIFSIKWYS